MSPRRKKIRTDQGKRGGGQGRASTRRRPRSSPGKPPAATLPKTTPPAGARRPADRLVALRVAPGDSGLIGFVPRKADVVEAAAEWMYILRNRSRWADDEDLCAAQRERAVETLARLGVGQDALGQVVTADSRHLELEFEDVEPRGEDAADPQDGASAFPWEFVLSSATRERGRSRPLLITRTFARQAVPPEAAGDLVFLESAPGRLEGVYSFDSERARLRAAMGGQQWRTWPSPTLSWLASRIMSQGPRVIHVSGIDNHQAAQLVDGFYEGAPAPSDGLVMRGYDKAEEPVAYQELAKALVGDPGARPAPRLVTINAYYSAARTARECVRRGAHAAIGFLDEVDDALAEYFFQTFYWAWRGAGETIDAVPRAFGRTWNLLRQRGQKLFGTGIVLWMARSAFEASRQAVFLESEDGPEEALESRLPTPQELSHARRQPIHDVLQVSLEVPDQINYSLLHNSRSFLESLTLTKLVEHPLDEVSVEVLLAVGDGSLPYRHTETLLNQPQLALAEDVKIPLTAALLRSPRERVQSTLYVRVAWDRRVACEETRSVTLLPVDEWFDDTEKNPWLPSFVLPRDPAVARIVAAARRHLVTLQDDPVAGFDGFQSTDAAHGDCDTVDEQVQALWTALVQEFHLAYVNPPPAYSRTNQRLRTPSEVLASSSGTCIDLSLLLASCLEYVDIYPVVVLLSGHAFAGYWRAEEYHDEFCRAARIPKGSGIRVGPYAVQSKLSLVDPYGWRLARQQYREILEYVRLDRLRFLEATGLCFNYSYADAIEEGRADIKAPDDFDSLLDIALARQASPPVTPLPMILTARDA